MNLPQDYRKLSATQRREVRQQYIIEQDGMCHYCGGDINAEPPAHIKGKRVNWSLFPRGEGFLKYPIHLHHDHKTGMTIGAVHALCNAVSWQYDHV